MIRLQSLCQRRFLLKKFFVFLINALFITACQSTLPQNPIVFTPTPTTQSIETEISLPTPTPYPTFPAPSVSTELQGVTIETGEAPHFIEATGSQPSDPGTYIIYINNRGDIRYVSLDGKKRDTLFDIDFEKFHYIPDLPSHKGIQFLAGESPKIALSSLSDIIDEEHAVLFTDLAGNPIQTWQLNPEGWGCFTPSFSPQGDFAIIECMESGRYLNLINLGTNDVEKSYHLPSCDSEIIHPMPIIWRQSGKDFLYHCKSFRNIYCFISLDQEPVCKSIQLKDPNGQVQQPRILSISPDWSKIAFDMGYQPADENGFILGYRVYVANTDCVIKEDICTEITVIDLPFAYPYNPNQERASRPGFQIVWRPTKNELVGNTSSQDNNSNDKKSIVGIYDLEKEENRFFRVWDSSIELISISPDGEWLVYKGIEFMPGFDGAKQYYATSLENGMIHSLASSIEFWPTRGAALDHIEFFGWLVIP